MRVVPERGASLVVTRRCGEADFRRRVREPRGLRTEPPPYPDSEERLSGLLGVLGDERVSLVGAKRRG